MKTILDETEYIFWITAAARLEFKGFRLELAQTGSDDARIYRKVIVEFDNVLFVQAFNEFARKLDDDESRESHVLARHSDSALKRWVKEYTVLFDTDANEESVEHYSIMAADNIYHVLSDTEPRVREDDTAQP
jgi:hypothetical protein